MRFQPIAAAAAALLLVAGTATAASAETWDFGGDPDVLWGTGANWDTNVAPAQVQPLIFGTAGAVAVNNLGDGFAVGSLTINRVPFGLAGQRILLNGDLTITAAGSVNLSLPIDINTQVSNWAVPLGATLNVDAPVFPGPGNRIALDSVGLTNFGPAGALNGNRVDQSGADGHVVLAGGGTLDTYRLNSGSLYLKSVLPNVDITAFGGEISGGSAANIGDQQLVASVTFDGGGILSPGDDVGGEGIGEFHSSDSITGDDLAFYDVGVDGLASDVVVTSGVFSPDGMHLEVAAVESGVLPPVGTEMTIVDAAGGPEDGSFFTDSEGNDILDGGVFFADPGYFRVDYNTTEIVLTYLGLTDPNAPAPTAPALPATGVDVSGPLALGVLALGIGGLVLVARRRQRA